MKLFHVVGARPNFMKVAPVTEAINAFPEIRQSLVHTGQHYDANMSEIFFVELGMPRPDYSLDVGSGSHARQTAEIMVRLEALISAENPDLVLVYGDVNSTIAAALVASKLGVRVGHVEAGLRSWDRSMPEEINRVLTDQNTYRRSSSQARRPPIRVFKRLFSIDAWIDLKSSLGAKEQPPRKQPPS